MLAEQNHDDDDDDEEAGCRDFSEPRADLKRAGERRDESRCKAAHLSHPRPTETTVK